jgi:putative acetyltransferase
MAPSNVTLRPATGDDLPAMKALFVQTIRSACKEDYTPAEIEAWAASANDAARWKGKLEHQYVIVAETPDELVGFASLDGADVVDLMFVHAGFQRKGIADRLHHAVEQEAIRRGAHVLYANVSLTARLFFAHAGYDVVAERLVTVRDAILRQYQMAKPLL